MKNRSLLFVSLLLAGLAAICSSQNSLAFINKASFFAKSAEPLLIINGTVSPFVGVEGSAVGPKTFSITTTPGNVVSVKAPSRFEVSGSFNSGFDTVFNYTAPGNNRTIYVRPKPGALGTFADSILVDIGVARRFVPVSATISPRPTISLNGWNGSLLTVNATTAATFVSISYVETINSPDKISIVAANGPLPGFTDIIDYDLPPSPLVVPVNNLQAGEYNFLLSVTNSNTGATSISYPVKLVVTGAPASVVVNGTLAPFTPTGNTPSAPQTFTVTTQSLNTRVTVKAPNGFQVALPVSSGSLVYLDSVSYRGADLQPAALSTQVYVRSRGDNFSLFGNVVVSAEGFTHKLLAGNSQINNPITIDLAYTNLSVTTPVSSNVFNFLFNFGPNSGPADQFIATPGTRAMPGFTSAEGNLRLFSGYDLNVPIPAGGPGIFDFIIRLRNSASGVLSAPYQVTVYRRGVENITAPAAVNSTFYLPSAFVPFSFTAKGLKNSLLSVTAPFRFELAQSANGQGVDNINLPVTNGQVGPVTLYVRLTAQLRGSYAGNILLTDGEDGRVAEIAIPTSVVQGGEQFLVNQTNINGFTATAGSPSVSKTFMVKLAEPYSDFKIVASAGFEVAYSELNPVYKDTLLTAQRNDGEYFVRMKPGTAGNKSGAITISGGGATKIMTVNGTITAAPSTVPTIALTGWNGSLLTVNATTAATFVSIAYTGTTNSPNKISIVAANGPLPGFTDIINYDLPASPLVIPVNNLQAGEYNFLLTVTNSTTGVSSISHPVKLVVTQVAPNPIALRPDSLTANRLVASNATSVSIPLYFAEGSGPADRFTLTPGTRALPGFTAIGYGNIQMGADGYTANVAIPAGSPGIYDFNLKLRSSTTGDSSAVYPIRLFKRGLQNVSADSIIYVNAGQTSTVRPFTFTAKGLTSSSLTILPQTGQAASVLFYDQTTNTPYSTVNLPVTNGQVGPVTLYVRAVSSNTTGDFITTMAVYDGGPSNLIANVPIKVRVAAALPAAPAITVAGSQTYTTTVPISPLTPTNSGGVVPTTGYGFTTTFAGSTTGGSANGSALSATFSGIWGMVRDAQGNIYVGDNYAAIRKISGGVVTNFTNTGGGEGMVFDAAGNMFVAVDNVINKITPAGVVSVFVGNSSAHSSIDGTGTAATFNGASGIAIDAAGNLYVAEQSGRKIRKITPAGVVTTFAGSGVAGATDGTGTAATFRFPTGLAFDAAGNLYVADVSSQAIRKITPAGVVTTLAGSGNAGYADGQGAAASFTQPYGITYDAASGDLFVASARNIRRVTTSGLVTTVAGGPSAGFVNGQGSAARFNNGYAIVNDNAGNIYVSEGTYIRKVSTYGYGISPALPLGLSFNSSTGAISGTPQFAAAARTYTISAANAGGVSHAAVNITVNQFPAPAITYAQAAYNFSNGSAITDLSPTNSGGAVPTTPSYGQAFTLSGTTTAGSANGTLATATYTGIWGMAFDANRLLYIGDNYAAIRRVSSGSVSNFTNTGGGEGMVFDAAGNMYVAADNLINRVTPAGVVSVFAGNATRSSVDGTGTAATFNGASGIAIDAAGNLFVSEQSGRKIRKITPARVVTTFAGSGASGSADGTGTAATFKFPTGLVFDNAGNLYVADVSSQAIRKITPAGVVTTLAGSGVAGNADGQGTAASFTAPYGLTYDQVTNDLFVACNRNIRRVSSTGAVTTVSGGVDAGFINGPGNVARFKSAYAIVYDGAGSLLISEGTYIRRVTVYGYGVMPELPAGLAFNTTNGTISGTPTAAAAAKDYVITAANNGGVSRANVNITVTSILSAYVDTAGIKKQAEGSWKFNVSPNEGTPNTYTITAGPRAMPGFIAQTGTLQPRLNGNGTPIANAFAGTINAPAGSLGIYDFNIRLKNTTTGDSSRIYRFVGHSRGLENVTSPVNLTFTPGDTSSGPLVAFTFTAKGLTNNFIMIAPSSNENAHVGFYRSPTDSPSTFLFVDGANNQVGPITIYLSALGRQRGESLGSLLLYDGVGTPANLMAEVPFTFKPIAPVASHHLTFSNTTATSTNVSWTNGNGKKRAVFVKQVSSGVAAARDSVTYTAGNFGASTQIGTTGWYCVYNGTGNSTAINGLSPSATYRVTVIDYSGTPGYEFYIAGGLAPANVTTLVDPAAAPVTPASRVLFANTTANSTTVSWTNGSGSARAVFIANTNNGTAAPIANTTYNANTAFGAGTSVGTTGWYCIYNGTGSTVNVTGLTGNQTYRVTVVEYNGTTGAQKYGTTGLAPGTMVTPVDPNVAPTVAYRVGLTNFTSTSMRGSFYGVDLGNRAVFISSANNGVPAPVNNTTYTPSGNFGSGTQIGSTGWYCVYVGNNSQDFFDITGLTPNTTYRVVSVAYNGTNGTQKYGTTGLNPAIATTLADPAAAPTLASGRLAFSNITNTTATVSWTNGNGANRAVFVSNSAFGVAAPVANTTYAPNTNFGAGSQIGSTGWYCVYVGNASTVNLAGLTSGGTYRVTVVDYNGTAGSQKYVTSGLAPANVTTTGIIAPSQASYRLTFTGTTQSSTTVNWTSGNGSARAVFVKVGNNGAAAPANNTTYTANASFAAGTQIGSTGWYCVYVGTGSSTTISGLNASSVYRVTVVDYNGTAGGQQYVTSGLAPATVVTPSSGGSSFRTTSLATADPNLTVDKPTLEVANILTPNGDGKNDTWIVKNIEAYPNSTVAVFTKDGKQIFREKGYYNEWNGGGSLTKGTYYYTIDLGNGETQKGYITVL